MSTHVSYVWSCISRGQRSGLMVDYSRFDHIDTSDSEDGLASPQRHVPTGASHATEGAPENVLEDLEDYFERLDARRGDVPLDGIVGDDPTAMPSVERFDDTDLSALSRRRPDGSDSVECSICLAHLLPSEEAVQLPCAARHTFHNDCVRPWLMQNVTCPLCRVDVRSLVRSQGRVHHEAVEADTRTHSPRAFGYTRDGGVILRYEPRPPPELPRPHYIHPDLHSVAELVEIEYPDRGTARIWRVPRGL
ncbi:unnamed protein product [Effrenium voratum]|nr:unnamed protein product [Effrenium voratum]